MMSNSGEEERLSTPTEESAEDAEKDQEEEAPQGDRNGRSSSKVKVVSQSQSRKSVAMTRSNSPPPDRGIISEEVKMPRRFVQISEENIVLKKQLKKQEERIKILATKLIRVISERSNKAKREEILLDEQKARIADLEHEVSNLRDKLQVSKQQLASHTKLIPHHPLPLSHHHHHAPPSRQASMLSSSTATTSHSKLKKPRSARSTSEVGGGSQPPRPSTATSSRGNLLIDKNFADRVEELLLEAKAENQALEDQLKHCRQRLTSTEGELEKLKEDSKSKEAEHQEEILKIKSQLGKDQDISKKKKQLSDNIQLIRLQRESRRTASWLSTLEAQCLGLESRLAAATENAGQLESQLVETQEELGQEQQKSITLQKQMEDATSSLSRLKELEAQIGSLQEENKILKEANDSLLKKAFSVTQKAEKAESVEISMKVQMSHLETVLKSEMRSKMDLHESLRGEKEKCVRLEMTNEHLQETLVRLNEEMKRYKILSSTTSETTVSPATKEPATTTKATQSSEKESCHVDNCPHLLKASELEEELKTIKSQLSNLKDEHGKEKLTLKSQLTANEEYKREIEVLTAKLDKADEFHHNKLQEFVQVLEERTRQISHLERFIDEWKNQQLLKYDFCKLCGNCLKNQPTSPIPLEGNGDNPEVGDDRRSPRPLNEVDVVDPDTPDLEVDSRRQIQVIPEGEDGHLNDDDNDTQEAQGHHNHSNI